MDYEALMKKSNIRATYQRITILEFLHNTKTHPTVDEIYKNIRYELPNISLATIYKNLHILCESNVVQEIKILNYPSRYDSNPESHYHIICTNCGSVIDLHYPLLIEIESLASRLHNFTIFGHQLNIYGICEECNQNSV